MPPHPDFTGAKIALIHEGSLLTYLRDDNPGIPYPAYWDMPGGGREGSESPIDCALRETEEEFGLRLPPGRVLWQRSYPSLHAPGRTAWQLAGAITPEEIAAIRFGDEGQYWRMMPIGDFLAHERAVPYLQTRLAEYLRDAEN